MNHNLLSLKIYFEKWKKENILNIFQFLGNNQMMSSYVLQGQVKTTASSNNIFLKHDADDSDASDQEVCLTLAYM